MIADIMMKWEDIWRSGFVKYFPDQNDTLEYRSTVFPLTLLYVPERAKRFPRSGCPYENDLKEPSLYLHDFGDMVLLPNNRPFEKYHSLLCTKKHIPQNDFERSHIEEITEIVEESGVRAFFNLRGAGASIDHIHAQVVLGEFNIERLCRRNSDYLREYPYRHVLVSGSVKSRCDRLYEHMRLLSGSGLKTLKCDGTYSGVPLFTLLFWKDNIMFVPRKREAAVGWATSQGGLEISGSFPIVTSPVEYPSTRLIRALDDMMYS